MCGLDPALKKVFKEGQFAAEHKGLGVDISLREPGHFTLHIPPDKREKGLALCCAAAVRAPRSRARARPFCLCALLLL